MVENFTNIGASMIGSLTADYVNFQSGSPPANPDGEKNRDEEIHCGLRDIIN